MTQVGLGEFPDSDTVSAVLAQAVSAPSIRNSQPWLWQVDRATLRLYADTRGRLCRTDSDSRDVLISCGASLHHCAVALDSRGWHPTIRRLPDPAQPSLLAVVSVRPQPPGELDSTLAAAIGRRRTDRRKYSPWSVHWGDIALLGARAARAGVMLRQVDGIPWLRAAVADAVSRRAADPDYLGVLDAGRQPAAANGAGGGNGAVVALGTESDDRLARLRAGEATSLVLLSATSRGLATCPVTEPLEAPQTREGVRADVFGSAGYPQVLIRLGWAPADAEPLPATPRRPLEAGLPAD